MSIRNAAKAIVIHNGKLLLNKCHSPRFGAFYTIPGGGQHQYETLEEAVVREVLEETGYTVIPEAFAALYEEIYCSGEVRAAYPDYAHKIFHIFRCRLSGENQATPSELDDNQTGCMWVDIGEAASLPIRSACIGENIVRLCHGDVPVYLGSHALEDTR